MNTQNKPTETSQKKSKSNTLTANGHQAESGSAVHRTLKSSPLVVSLLVILIAAVLIQCAILMVIYMKNLQANETENSATTPVLEEALVAKSSPASPAPQTIPMGSLPTDDFFSNDWQPFEEMARMREEMDRLFENSFTRFKGLPGFDQDWLESTRAAGNCTLSDEGEHYLVRCEIPNAEESSLDVKLENGILSISGEEETINERKDQEGRIVESSRSVSRFQRSFDIPDDSDPAAMTSDFQDGTLSIKIPKK